MTIDGSMIISGFISKVVNDCVDVLKEKIKDADKNRKAYEQNIETRIYQVIIDSLNELTYNKFTEQDVLYDSAESILKGLKSGKNDIAETVRVGLIILGLQVSGDTDKEFWKILCHEICKDENDVLYKEIIMLQYGKMIEGMHEGFKQSHHNEEQALEKLDYVIDKLDEKGVQNQEGYGETYPENRAEEYAQKWDKNVFLNNFNERDENAGTNIKLREIYLEEHLPHYIWKANINPQNDLKDLLKEYIVDNDNRRMLLILGQAGTGKSTLITWILSNLVEQKNDIFVYQFASDLKNVNWTEDNILNEIVKTIGLKHTELEGRTLILDGFDEISANGDKERILNKLNQELKVMNILQRFSLIINCRENYIDQSDLGNIEYIILQVWNEEQIKSFCENYEKKSARKNSEAVKNSILEVKISKLMENKEVFGIPLILYMVLALNADIEESSSRVEIYDQIFSLKRGGIYDRCYDIEHRINAPEIKKHIHRISQRIAFWMFENNADKAFISQEKFEEICENEMKESGKNGEDIQRDALIGNFFKFKYCEGNETDEIQFVHRSIYEYFVTVYFFESIHKLTSKEEVAGKLGELLKDGHLSKQILEFIKCKFDSIKENNLPEMTKEIFQLMLQDGMTFHVKEKYKNVVDREMNIFSNMLEVVHKWNLTLNSISNELATYLHYNNSTNLNLNGIKLSNADLYCVFLESSHLNNANLEGADLSGANLNVADLRKANLNVADLRKANLIGADLSEADLRRADLSEADLRRADLRGADLKEAVLRGTNLVEADLFGADLRKVDLSTAILGNLIEGVILDENQVDLLKDKYHYCFNKMFISEGDVRDEVYCFKK